MPFIVIDLPYNGSVAFIAHYRLIEAKDVVFECGPNCGCGPNCVNRTSQRGLKHRLEVSARNILINPYFLISPSQIKSCFDFHHFPVLRFGMLLMSQNGN